MAGSAPAPIDLLLTDVVMPGMNGRELAEEFARLHPAARVLYMSGYTDDEVFRRGVSEGKHSFLRKPFSTTALTAHVRSTLAGRSRPGITPPLP